ncbi:MAG: hypothetical protein ABR915_02145 [Thermoguttaceae bacterium]|jgi:hypothetical protein
MDGLLEPEDAEDLRKKIEASKFATDMFHRIRDVMRRLRLTAPSLSEHGSGLDPNTVAEYLDNALGGDRVPDFEKLCLESDMHLAEVASCHQILALVLGEPAEIDPASRERMYQVPQVAGLPKEERLAAAAAAAMLSGDGSEEELAAQKGRPKPTVPEYLREGYKRRRLLPVAAMLLLFGGFLGILLLALGQFEPGTPLGRLVAGFRARFQTAAGPERGQPSPAPPAGGPSTAPAQDASNSPKAKDGKTGAEGPAEERRPELPGAEKPTAPGAEKPAVPGTEPGAPATNPPAAKPGGVEAPPAEEPGATPPENPGPSLVPGPKELPRPPVPAEKSAIAAKPPEPEPPPENVRIGRFISDAREVLLRYNGDLPAWLRVAPEEFLQSGQPLLALPTYRPRVVVLKVGVTAELLGGTEIELAGPDAQGEPGINVAFGRLVVKPLAQPGIRIRLLAGGQSGVLTLSTVDSMAAVEVVRTRAPGSDPQTTPSDAAVTLYVAQGEAVWEDGVSKQAVRLPAPARWSSEISLAGPPGGGAAKALPKWIVTDTSSPLEHRAAATVAQAFGTDRPASLVLTELAEDRRFEVHWLATRCLAYLGQFEPMVAALDVDDRKVRWQWPEYVDQLRQAVVRGPASATAVRQALEKRYGADGANLYRMLWGYADKQLVAGEDAQLVKGLESESLAVRVLAFWNLKEITGSGFFYRPEDPVQKRGQAGQRWKQLLEAGGVRNRTAEEKSRVVEPAAAGTTPADTAPADATSPAPPRAVVPEPPEPAAGAEVESPPSPAATPPPEPPRAVPPEPMP